MVHFRRALELKADHAGAQANLGDALLQEGQLDEAIAHYQTALLAGSLRMEIARYQTGCPYRIGDYPP